jgi:hypothetical protein
MTKGANMLQWQNNSITPQVNGVGGAAQANAATLPATAGRTQYLEGFDVTGGGATAAAVIEVSVTGLAGGTLKFEMNVLAGVTGPVNAQGGLFIRFPEPLPASAVNSAITVTVPSFGAGNTNAAVVAYGFLA